MENSALDKMVDQLAEVGFAWVDSLLSEAQLDGLVALIKSHDEQDNLKKAAIGNFDNLTVDKQVRGDWIKWIDKQVAHSVVKVYIDVVQVVMDYLNRTLYLGLKDFELHYTLYPKGTRYMRHRDQFQTTQHRRISFVLYLNKEWEADLGGELILYNEDNQATVVAPKYGRLALFFSELEHEVTQTHFERLSVTGWMLDVPASLTFLTT